LLGIHPQTAYRWFREGTVLVPAVRVNSRSVLVAPDAVTAAAGDGGLGLYARVSSHDHRADLDRRVALLAARAAPAGQPAARIEAEVGSA
jgi:putative resolvase